MVDVDKQWKKADNERRATITVESCKRVGGTDEKPVYEVKFSSPTPDPRTNIGWDRITITLTEREAELVRGVCWMTGNHMGLVSTTLCGAGVKTVATQVFDFDDFHTQSYGRGGYAHAERVSEIVSSDNSGTITSAHTVTRIKLTMDRDVAVTLAHLISRVEPMGELSDVRSRIYSKLPVIHLNVLAFPPRFTGTIRWKKRKVRGFDCETGKTYKALGNDEWEPVEE